MNLTNTTWMFNVDVNTTNGLGEYNIDFTSNGENFVKLSTSYRGYTPISYYGEDGVEVKAYDNSNWTKDAYRTITITGGVDVENTNLLSFLNAAATQKLEFTETKTGLKIYEGLTAEEYAALTKEPHSFYIVEGVGVYKGETLISTSTDLSNLEHDIELLERQVENLTTHTYGLDSTKQNKLTAGEGIEIAEDGTISATGGVTEEEVNDLIATYMTENYENGNTGSY